MKIFWLLFCFVASAASPGWGETLTEKSFNKDMAYYERTAKSKKLSSNDRLFILEKFRQKYKDTDFDLSPLYAEIDRWYGIRLNEKPRSKTPEYARLTQVLVTEGPDFSRLILEVPGNDAYKDEIKKDSRGANPPVLLLYLYETKEELTKESKNFTVPNGAIRQFRADKVASTPPMVKVQVALREDRPYRIERDGNQLVLTFTKQDAAQAPPVPMAPTDALEAAGTEESPPEETTVGLSTSTIPITVIGAVKTQGRLDAKEGIKLLEAVYLAGGFTEKAALDRIRVVRKDQGKQVTLEFSAMAELKKNPAKDVVLKSGDLVIVPEKNSLKDKIFNGKVVPWATFFISMGLVLALLI